MDVVLIKESLQTKHNAAKACSTTEDDSDIDIDTQSGPPGVAEEADENSDSESVALSDHECIDIVKVASGHLISLKCKAGVTQSLLPSIVEMNEAVIDSVVTNISSKVMERLQANGVQAECELAKEVKDAIESHRNPLRSLRTVYCQNSLIQAHYPMIVSLHAISIVYYNYSIIIIIESSKKTLRSTIRNKNQQWSINCG